MGNAGDFILCVIQGKLETGDSSFPRTLPLQPHGLWNEHSRANRRLSAVSISSVTGGKRSEQLAAAVPELRSKYSHWQKALVILQLIFSTDIITDVVSTVGPCWCFWPGPCPPAPRKCYRLRSTLSSLGEHMCIPSEAGREPSGRTFLLALFWVQQRPGLH